MLRAIPKVGTRNKQWLIVNEFGGLVKEFTGTKRQASREVERLNRRSAPSVGRACRYGCQTACIHDEMSD